MKTAVRRWKFRERTNRSNREGNEIIDMGGNRDVRLDPGEKRDLHKMAQARQVRAGARTSLRGAEDKGEDWANCLG